MIVPLREPAQRLLRVKPIMLRVLQSAVLIPDVLEFLTHEAKGLRIDHGGGSIHKEDTGCPQPSRPEVESECLAHKNRGSAKSLFGDRGGEDRSSVGEGLERTWLI